MWPFRKKYPPIDDLPRNDWAVGTGEHNGQLMIVRLNTAAHRISGHPDYPHQVGIAVPLVTPRPDGMPDENEAEALRAIEDALETHLAAGFEALLVAVITTNGMREFVYYTSNAEGTRTKVNQLDAAIEGHDLQLIIQLDPEWQIFKGFGMTP